MTLYFPEKVIAHINVNWLFAGEGAYHVDRRRETNAGVERPGSGPRRLKSTTKASTSRIARVSTTLLVNYRSGDMWSPQLEQAEALRHELAYFVECISSGEQPFNDGCAGLAGGQDAGGRASESLSKKGRAGLPMSGFHAIAEDVKLGENVRLSKFINLYGCEIGDETKIGAFVEIQKNTSIGKRCKISSQHVHLRGCHH